MCAHTHTNFPTHFLCLCVGCSLCSLCQLGGMLTWLGWPFDELKPSLAQTAANTVATANAALQRKSFLNYENIVFLNKNSICYELYLFECRPSMK